jgi:DNA repair exonuclease SbcCD ATPase subunit
MVGVISHVQELKDALPNGITIVPTNKGSVADIHYPEP